MSLRDLLNKHFETSNQVKFAIAAGVEQSTVSRWKNHDIPPTYENCLRIAKALNTHPSKIFEAAERPEFNDLFNFYSPEYQPKEPQQPGVSEVQQIFDALSHEAQTFALSQLRAFSAFEKTRKLTTKKERTRNV